MKKGIAMTICLLLGAAFLTGCSGNDADFQQKSYTADGTQISEIRIDVRDRKIEVSASDDDHVHLDYFESSKEYYDISVSDDKVLTVNAVADKEWTDYVGGKPSADHRAIFLKIPDSLLSALTLSTTNEDIVLSPLTVTGSVSLTANGGSIQFDGLDAGKTVTLNGKNGDISGTLRGSYDDYAIVCEIKKGESNLPAGKEDGEKILHVTGNNGNIDITFVKP